MSETVQGRRRETAGDGVFPADPLPGDYWLGANGVWWVYPPRGAIGHISNHTVTVHDDGAITVFPSILMPNKWHGYLEHGVWREC